MRCNGAARVAARQWGSKTKGRTASQPSGLKSAKERDSPFKILTVLLFWSAGINLRQSTQENPYWGQIRVLCGPILCGRWCHRDPLIAGLTAPSVHTIQQAYTGYRGTPSCAWKPLPNAVLRRGSDTLQFAGDNWRDWQK
jgi:hypothetical protein